MKLFTLLICLFIIDFAYAGLVTLPLKEATMFRVQPLRIVVIPDTYNSQPIIKTDIQVFRTKLLSLVLHFKYTKDYLEAA